MWLSWICKRPHLIKVPILISSIRSFPPPPSSWLLTCKIKKRYLCFSSIKRSWHLVIGPWPILLFTRTTWGKFTVGWSNIALSQNRKLSGFYGNGFQHMNRVPMFRSVYWRQKFVCSFDAFSVKTYHHLPAFAAKTRVWCLFVTHRFLLVEQVNESGNMSEKKKRESLKVTCGLLACRVVWPNK